MTFAAPLVLVLAALAPVVVALAYAFDRARRRALLGRLGEAGALGRMMASVSPRRRRLKAALLALALALLLVAAARPQVNADRVVKRSGLDLALVVDTSSSMRVIDRGVMSRHERARGEIGALLDERAGDRVALVMFAGAAIHFPLTEDHDVLLALSGEIGPADLPGGSDLGEGLRVARCLLRADLVEDLGCRGLGGRGRGGAPLAGDQDVRQPDGLPGRVDRDQDDADAEEGERGKAILVFTDGGDRGPGALEEVERARDLGIAVFFAGVGTAEGGKVPDIDADDRTVGVKHDAGGQPVISRLDDEGLRALAAASGDPERYLALDWDRAPEARRYTAALRDVARGIRTRSDVARREDVYAWFLFPAFLLLVIEACIATRRRVRYPEAADVADAADAADLTSAPASAPRRRRS